MCETGDEPFTLSSRLSESSEKLISPAPCTPVAPCQVLRFTADSRVSSSEDFPPPSIAHASLDDLRRPEQPGPSPLLLKRSHLPMASRATSESQSAGGAPLDVQAWTDEVEQWRAQHSDPFGLGKHNAPSLNAVVIDFYRRRGKPLPASLADVDPCRRCSHCRSSRVAGDREKRVDDLDERRPTVEQHLAWEKDGDTRVVSEGERA